MIKPYLHLLMLAVIAAVLGGVFAWGRSSGRAVEAEAHAPAHAKLQRAYELAHTGLLNAGAALRNVAAIAREDAARAAQQQALGAAAAAGARQDARDSKARAEALDAALQRERSTCTQGEARICGVPLR